MADFNRAYIVTGNTIAERVPKSAGNVGENIVTSLSFTFSDEWLGASKTIVFKSPKKALLTPIALVDDSVPIPVEALDSAGKLQFSLQGTFTGSAKVIRTPIKELDVKGTLPYTGGTPIATYTNVVSECQDATVLAETATSTALTSAQQADAARVAIADVPAQEAEREIEHAKWVGASAEATTLSAGAEATASVTDGETGKVFNIGVPQGPKGDTGDVTDDFLVNRNNLLPDFRMLTATPMDVDTTILEGFPSKIAKASNTVGTVKGFSLSLGNLFNPKVLGTYYLKFKVKGLCNAASVGQAFAIYLYRYLGASLKGSWTIFLDTPSTSADYNDFKEYTYTITVDAAFAAIDKFIFYFPNKYDAYVKDVYVTQDAADTEPYSFYNKFTEREKIKLGIIGDSLSSAMGSAALKYHHYLTDYTIDNQAVSGSSYASGSLFNGTQDHQFYNQATRLADDCKMVLVFGSLNDISMTYGKLDAYNASGVAVIIQYSCSHNNTGAQLTGAVTTGIVTRWDAPAGLAIGTYYITIGAVNYQFVTSAVIPVGGYLNITIYPIGAVTDTGTTSICGLFNTMLANLYEKNIGMLVGIALPTPWFGYNARMGNNNPYYAYMWDYINALIALAAYHDLPLIDLFRGSNLRPWDAAFKTAYYYKADGTHPNNDGHRYFLYPKMREFLNGLNYK